MIRSNPETKDIPILVATVLFSELDLRDCIEAGCDNFIVKLFTVQELQRKIRELIPASSRRFNNGLLIGFFQAASLLAICYPHSRSFSGLSIFFARHSGNGKECLKCALGPRRTAARRLFNLVAHCGYGRGEERVKGAG